MGAGGEGRGAASQLPPMLPAPRQGREHDLPKLWVRSGRHHALQEFCCRLQPPSPCWAPAMSCAEHRYKLFWASVVAQAGLGHLAKSLLPLHHHSNITGQFVGQPPQISRLCG